MRHRAVLLTFILAGCGGSAPPPAMPSPGIVSITAEELRADVTAFAADSFEGRETGTPAAFRAARFIAQRLVSLGMEPGGDSLYYQRVPLIRTEFAPTTRLTVTSGTSTYTLALGTDVAPLLSVGAGAPLPKRSATGDVHFAGYGMNEMGRRDFEGITEPGKVIVMLHSAPASVTDTIVRKRLESQEALGPRIQRALELQPAAIVLLMTGATTGFYNQILPDLMRSVATAPGDQTTSDAQRPLPMILFGLARAGSPLLPPTWPSDDAPRALERRFSARIETLRQPFTGYNVVGIVRGTDARLNKSYIAYGAHYDHIGVLAAVGGDSIANGADDDASGSMALLAVAKSLTTSRPRRSSLFVWHVGEEKGMLGSGWFVERPTVPLDSIVAMINLDMIGRRGGPSEAWNSARDGASAADRVYIVGPNAAPNGQSRVLGAVLDTVNRRQVRPLRLDPEWDSATHPENIYERSDHYQYASKGIPIVFLTTGLHEDYHKVTDEPAKLDYDKMSRIASLVLELGTTLANREGRPR